MKLNNILFNLFLKSNTVDINTVYIIIIIIKNIFIFQKNETKEIVTKK